MNSKIDAALVSLYKCNIRASSLQLQHDTVWLCLMETQSTSVIDLFYVI